jgi:hypothetical protein
MSSARAAAHVRFDARDDPEIGARPYATIRSAEVQDPVIDEAVPLLRGIKGSYLALAGDPAWSADAARAAAAALAKAHLGGVRANLARNLLVVAGDGTGPKETRCRSMGAHVRDAVSTRGIAAPWVVVAPVVPDDARGMAIAYRRAVVELAIVQRICPLPRIVTDEDCLVWRALSIDVALRRRMSEMVRPLVDERNAHSVLLDTIQIYSEENLSVEATANRMTVHRNTVKYRLRRVERIVGYSLRQGNERLLLELAVIAWRLENDGLQMPV